MPLVDQVVLVSGTAHLVSLLLHPNQSPALVKQPMDVEDLVYPAQRVGCWHLDRDGGVSSCQTLLLSVLHLGVQLACSERHLVLHLLHSPAHGFGPPSVRLDGLLVPLRVSVPHELELLKGRAKSTREAAARRLQGHPDKVRCRVAHGLHYSSGHRRGLWKRHRARRAPSNLLLHLRVFQRHLSIDASNRSAHLSAAVAQVRPQVVEGVRGRLWVHAAVLGDQPNVLEVLPDGRMAGVVVRLVLRSNTPIPIATLATLAIVGLLHAPPLSARGHSGLLGLCLAYEPLRNYRRLGAVGGTVPRAAAAELAPVAAPVAKSAHVLGQHLHPLPKLDSRFSNLCTHDVRRQTMLLRQVIHQRPRHALGIRDVVRRSIVPPALFFRMAVAVKDVEPDVMANVRKVLVRQRVVRLPQPAPNVPRSLGERIEDGSTAVLGIAFHLPGVVEAGAAHVPAFLLDVLVQHTAPLLVGGGRV
eukprot:7385880-Prymnesium_polylepis.2